MRDPPMPKKEPPTMPTGAAPTACAASDGTPVIFPPGFKPPPQQVIDALVPVTRVKPAPSSKPTGPPVHASVPIVLTAA
eukprot:4761811-Amphidinium_carterae.1